MISDKSANQFRVLIIGGTGRTGQDTIRQALKMGFEVRALTRDAKKAIKFTEGNVEWFQCDARNAEGLKVALEGRDAVISTLGPDGTSKTSLYSDSFVALTQAMRSKGVKRLLTVTADWNNPNNPWIFKHVIRTLFLKHVEADQVLMEGMIVKMPTDQIQWTCVRPFRIIQKPFTGKYRVGPSDLEPAFKPESYTGDIGHFLCKEAQENKWVGKFVSIGY